MRLSENRMRHVSFSRKQDEVPSPYPYLVPSAIPRQIISCLILAGRSQELLSNSRSSGIRNYIIFSIVLVNAFRKCNRISLRCVRAFNNGPGSTRTSRRRTIASRGTYGVVYRCKSYINIYLSVR